MKNRNAEWRYRTARLVWVYGLSIFALFDSQWEHAPNLAYLWIVFLGVLLITELNGGYLP